MSMAEELRKKLKFLDQKIIHLLLNMYFTILNHQILWYFKKISNYEKRKINLENKIKQLENENSDQAIKELKKLYKLDTYGELDFEALLIFTQSFDELSNLSSILPYYDVDPKKYNI